jgi:hypothetical protein
MLWLCCYFACGLLRLGRLRLSSEDVRLSSWLLHNTWFVEQGWSVIQQFKSVVQLLCRLATACAPKGCRLGGGCIVAAWQHIIRAS